ncbi:MAG: aminotransferase class I/II-fold pyridoxal phosphate-dependent enzyme [Methanoregulaceae archaeon]|nr:aminotransferase class I/II-fold pyridoxal phosphate-dependent enzyme [Methanoregulaceae archaeon]
MNRIVSGSFPEKVIHGGHSRRYSEKHGEPFLDFSANLNPFQPDIGWDPADVSPDTYPDDDYATLKECIARVFHRDPDEIAIGNGSIELIRVFCLASFRKGGTYRVDMPTFGEYAFSAELAGARAAPAGSAPAVTFLCNPNNPTGRLFSGNEVRAILRESVSGGSRLFLDEAFIELADPSASLVGDTDPGLFVLRSLTKSFSVPGIRFGYGFGEEDLVRMIETIRPPWSVNAYAEHFALKAFSCYDLLEESRARIAQERKWLHGSLESLGLDPQPAWANFILVGLGRSASDICARLEKYRILVRDCTSFGLPSSIRVAVRGRDENRRLVEALAGCLH